MHGRSARNLTMDSTYNSNCEQMSPNDKWICFLRTIAKIVISIHYIYQLIMLICWHHLCTAVRRPTGNQHGITAFYWLSVWFWYLENMIAWLVIAGLSASRMQLLDLCCAALASHIRVGNWQTRTCFAKPGFSGLQRLKPGFGSPEGMRSAVFRCTH